MLPYSAYASPIIRKILKNTPYWEDLQSKKELDRFLLDSIDRQTKVEILSDLHKVDEFHNRLGVHSILLWDDRFPENLRKIPDPPLVLFVQGNPDLLNNIWWGVVGTRKASPLAIRATQGIVETCIPQEYGIVSGLALGIDRISMLTSIEMDRLTMGVLGTSIEKEYPFSNRDLYKIMKSSKNSILISIYLPDTNYSKWTFPMRNRIITGLSEKVFLMETPMKSGAMSSAHSAIQQNRELYVFDHKYLYDNTGGRSLLADGAELITWEDAMPNSTVYHAVMDRDEIINRINPISSLNENSPTSEWEFRGHLMQLEQNQIVTSIGDDLYCINFEPKSPNN